MLTILTNATFYTLNPQQSRVDSLLIAHGRILAAGTRADLRALVPNAREQDLAGAFALPGLTDAHIHLEHYALSLQKVDCETTTLHECLQRIAERAHQTPPGQWILGHGWNHNPWGGILPTAADLDAVAPQHPVYLTAKSLHAGWANSLALQHAHINANTPNPEGGEIVRDPHGNPTGALLESAMHLVSHKIPQPSPEDLVQALQHAQTTLHRLGITAVHDFDRRRAFVALQTLHQRGNLQLRVLKNLPVEDLPHAIELGLRSGLGDLTLRIGGIKAFADGALGPHTAAMLQPYEGEPHNTGILLLDRETLFDYGRQSTANGLSLTVHAIGDRANHELLEAYTQLRAYERDNHLPHLRHRIEHVQLIHPQDAPRLAQLNLIASMQPIHALSDMDMANRYWGERAAFSYAWQIQQQAGAILAFGSDAPVDSPNPFWGLYAATTRRKLEDADGGSGWYTSQCLSLPQALAAYTRGPAYAANLENHLGQLAPGFAADLILLPHDPFSLPPAALRDLLPTATLFDGNWV